MHAVFWLGLYNYLGGVRNNCSYCNKGMLTDNTKNDGSSYWDKISRALMQHCNTPLDGIKFSPAQLLFGRPIRDFQPIRPGLFRPAEVWVECAEKREPTMRHRLSSRGERWTQNTRQLPPLRWVRRCLFKTRGEQASWPRGGTEQGRWWRIRSMTSMQSRLMVVKG